MIFEQFDIVQIIHTGRVNFLSGPRGKATSPTGLWSVVGVIDGELVLSKDMTIIRIPPHDAKKVGRYDYAGFLEKLKNAKGIPKDKENDDGESEERESPLQ